MKNGHEREVIIERRGTAGIIRLNRPRALNSLTLDMVRMIDTALDEFADDDGIASVVVAGEGERGFCAGGDIRVLHESGRSNSGLAETFWREEFTLNHRIANYAKPYIALMDGITMGGGVGLSAHGRHRIATERTRLAMPETGIGYFPDVGATWLLPRMPGETGTWAGLTGLELNAADAIYAGLADFQIPSSRLPHVIDALARMPAGSSSVACDALLKHLSEEPGESRLRSAQELIDRVFHFDSVEDIAEALGAEQDAFAVESLRVLRTRSPTSLKLTLRLVREGRNSARLAECLNRELAAGIHMLKSADFYEGVRAAVIDKDRNPKWSPSTLEAVDADMIAPFLKPLDRPLAI
ncbi:enoyl-CoA hydratase/isomerase family protein [Rhizobium sp. P32RR-XVIII]|uniref:enoyl-CoA hydratase/isomerase family protein n=1 Tax=Rhizobium sp. P32RR-XVIII TaxID=2726738 RepID=UPI00145700A7|nr:enoyl-CoA hydratase/isomerase family protein [Rhizobium sp. P32RR-XVIII]NLS02262.1 enoyl-CoA hydratase/isomerase family protein [Rhizobium sp. P32RR-XVIII]